MANSVDPDQIVCSGSTLFASLLNPLVMLGNYLQQTTLANDFFRCIFSWCFKVKELINRPYSLNPATACPQFISNKRVF